MTAVNAKGIKMNKKSQLTDREELLMELLWRSEKALTSVELLKIEELSGWNETYFHRTIKSLSGKGLIRVCGVERYNTQYARQFEPTLTREEYAIKILKERGINSSSIGRLAMALVKDVEDDRQGEEKDKLIEELEEIIENLRKDKG